MDLDRLARPCPSSRCEHKRGCWEADKRRAEGGHGLAAVEPRPKMDAQSLVAAVCSCGGYSSGPSSQAGARESWRQHADDKIATAAAR